MSTEEECLTAVPDAPTLNGLGIQRLLTLLPQLSPSLAGIPGIFNPYGRVYPDCGHVELAAIETDDPYVLPLIVERQHTLVARAVKQLNTEGVQLILANNNHSGLLQLGCNTWGSHENYMTEQHPTRFGRWILPFLVTRIFGGAGGVLHPSGDFLAAVRPLRMELSQGGGTTSCRAIHSTARDEPHMRCKPCRYRYHLLLGDGHRSHFNLALQFGSTCLALKAVQHDRETRKRIEQIEGLPCDDGWVPLLQEVNVLARADRPMQIHPRVIPIQRLYLEGAHRFVARLGRAPAWTARTLRDWEETLVALENLDRPWLSARLDAFAKYEFYSAVVEEAGPGWRGLTPDSSLFHELALLDHSYHEFANPNSVFTSLQQAGLLQHRVAEAILPGGESEPYVPEVQTRARARARFIRDHDKHPDYLVDWSLVYDRRSGKSLRLDDPFAEQFSDAPTDEQAVEHRIRSLRERLWGHPRPPTGVEDEVPF